jgi:hypothetical protein
MQPHVQVLTHNGETHQVRSRGTATFVLALGAVGMVYSLAYVLTWASIGRTAVPPKFGPDLFLYLSLARDLQEGGRLFLQTQYAYFPGAFHLFNIFDVLGSQNSNIAVFLNQITWVCLTFAACAVLLHRLYPDTRYSIAAQVVLASACTQFCLMNYSAVAELARYLVSLMWGSDSRSPDLPLNRQFYPQMTLPFILLYFSVALQALQVQRARLG